MVLGLLGEVYALRILLDFYYKAGYGFVAGDEHLMGQACRDVGHIAGSQLLASAAVDGSGAQFAGSDGLSAGERAASEQGCAAFEDVKNIGEVFMQFGLTVAATE